MRVQSLRALRLKIASDPLASLACVAAMRNSLRVGARVLGVAEVRDAAAQRATSGPGAVNVHA